MNTGALTGYIDVAQVVLYAFWIFFFALIWYLRREDKREGYPLESDRSGHVSVQGFPAMPPPKTFLLARGRTKVAPDPGKEQREIRLTPTGLWLGAPSDPTGDPMADGVGPASYTPRADHPDTMHDGSPMIVPLRVATDHRVASEDPDPRGLPVIAADGLVAGTIHDLWVDRSEPQIRYLEVAVATSGSHVLLPITVARIDGYRRCVRVKSISAAQFEGVPRTANPDLVTLAEEDRISGYYGGGYLYAHPDRMGPLL